MSSQDWHISQYTHNKNFSDDILLKFQSTYYDWTITSLFYSVLHRVDAYFSQSKAILPANHRERKEKIQEKLPLIYNQYEQLFMLSMQSRYQRRYNCMAESDVKAAQNLHQQIITYINKM